VECLKYTLSFLSTLFYSCSHQGYSQLLTIVVFAIMIIASLKITIIFCPSLYRPLLLLWFLVDIIFRALVLLSKDPVLVTKSTVPEMFLSYNYR